MKLLVLLVLCVPSVMARALDRTPDLRCRLDYILEKEESREVGTTQIYHWGTTRRQLEQEEIFRLEDYALKILVEGDVLTLKVNNQGKETIFASDRYELYATLVTPQRLVNLSHYLTVDCQLKNTRNPISEVP